MIKLLIKKAIQIINQINEIVQMILINHHITILFFRYILRDCKTKFHINFKISFINIDNIQI